MRPLFSVPPVLRLKDLDACGRRKSPCSLVADVEDSFSFRDSVGDLLSSDEFPAGDFCPLTAAAAACCARSFREALPRFFLSRMYSQPNANSTKVVSTTESFDNRRIAARNTTYPRNARKGFGRHI